MWTIAAFSCLIKKVFSPCDCQEPCSKKTASPPATSCRSHWHCCCSLLWYCNVLIALWCLSSFCKIPTTNFSLLSLWMLFLPFVSTLIIYPFITLNFLLPTIFINKKRISFMNSTNAIPKYRGQVLVIYKNISKKTMCLPKSLHQLLQWTNLIICWDFFKLYFQF